ncbi:MerR family transcriptional regulator [Polymorphobacter sp.]|uniref:MerR family transcriptional regulator n=1 Tax=Polymorphobacter sp. TaxID=1909290 RepID=UPI003F71FB03
MRMKELEKTSGVGRETIRFYIREGLLPEPERASRNSAFYSEEHVRRLKAIKRLQEELFLPLAVIKSVLDADDGDRWLAPDAFPMLDAMLAARVGGVQAPELLADVEARLEMEPGTAEGYIAIGMISVDDEGRVSGRDVKLLMTLKRLVDLGFSSRNGFLPAHMGFYVELIDWVVAQEMKLFFGHLAGNVGEAEAADMALEGMNIINEIIGQLHLRASLRILGTRRRIAQDRG